MSTLHPELDDDDIYYVPLKEWNGGDGKGGPYTVDNFTWNFQMENISDIQVRYDGIKAEQGKPYTWTIAMSANQGGGTLTFNQIPDINVTGPIQVRRRTPFVRTIKYTDNGDLLAATVNGDFDRLWYCLQEQRAASDAALSRPMGTRYWDAQGLPIQGLPDAKQADEPVTLGQVTGWTDNARASMLAAAASEANAQNSMVSAAASALAAGNSKTLAQDAANKAAADANTAAQALIQPAADAAAASAAAAAQSQQFAGTSEVNAFNSAAEAAASAAAAKVSETNAKGSEDNAFNYAEQAMLSALDAAAANPLQSLVRSANLSDVPDKAAARANLGVTAQVVKSGLQTRLMEPTDAGYVFVETDKWGAVNDLNQPMPLGVEYGGTGVKTLAELKAGLGVAPFSHNNVSTNITSPSGAYTLQVNDNGTWQMLDTATGVRSPLALTAGGTGATNDADARKALDVPATGDVYTKTEIDALVKKFGSGGYIGETFWHPMRSAVPAGCVTADGQSISAATYPALAQLLKDGKLPTTTITAWLNDPSQRGKYVYDETAGTIRVPDYNGTLVNPTLNGVTGPSSYGAPFLRGDAGNMTPGSILEASLPNITGQFNGLYSFGSLGHSGAFKSSHTGTAAGSGSGTGGGQILFKASDSNPVYGRDGTSAVYPNSITGCYVIRVATEAQNGGAVDVLSLQGDFASLTSQVASLNGQIGYRLLDFGTMGLNQRKALVNPFGNDTPVICIAEVYHSSLKAWVNAEYIFNGTNSQSFGTRAAAHPVDGIVVRTGVNAMMAYAAASGANYEFTASLATASPVRVHVFSIGKDISKLKQISQIDPALIAEFKTTPARPIDNQAIYSAADAAMVANTRIDLPADLRGTTIYIKLGTNTYYTPCLIPFLDDDSDFMFIANPTQSVVFTLKVGGTALVTKQFESGVRAVTGIRMPVFKQP